MRLVFLAALGISVATWLSFPVAILLCLVVFFSASISGFIIESFDSLGGGLGSIYSFTIRPLLGLLPQFDTLNPSTFIIRAQAFGLVDACVGGDRHAADKGDDRVVCRHTYF